MNSIIKQLMDEVLDFYLNVEKSKVVPKAYSEELRAHLNATYDFHERVPLDKLISDISWMMRQWTLHVTHPLYFGLYVPGVKMSSIIADTLVALYNPQLGSWSHAPAANEIEQFTLNYLLSQFGFNTDSCTANFTTGGTEANLSAVIVALTKAFPQYGDNGILSLKSQPLIYLTEEAHNSFTKIAHITGLGRNSLRIIETDESLKLDMNDLTKQLQEDKALCYAPFLVVGTAGTTSAGVIDPLPQLAEFCQEHNLWFHVDAAYGGAAILSPRLKPFLTGIELADSITCDAHKWFSVSMGAGMFFCKHKDAVTKAFRVVSPYMPGKSGDTIDLYDTTIQCSRRFIGLKVFMCLAELGIDGFAEMIEHQVQMGIHLRKALKNSGWTIMNDTPLPVVCFTHEKIINQEVSPSNLLQLLYDSQRVWISETKLKNKIPVLRACITNFRTEKSDIDLLVTELDKAITSQMEDKNY
ncbi:MAG: aminotransferase class V-fold PLP-dependent enzyme [candidate division Zixibacteria bacterium]|nr:aminotransferase class V-fold PLP-dependent enzyme [candidate division Zixibacteria bacterium]